MPETPEKAVDVAEAQVEPKVEAKVEPKAEVQVEKVEPSSFVGKVTGNFAVNYNGSLLSFEAGEKITADRGLRALLVNAPVNWK